MENTKRIKSLYEAYKNRSITPSEFDELTNLLTKSYTEEKTLTELILEDLEIEESLENPVIDRIIEKAKHNILSRTTSNTSIRKIKLIRYIAAASIVLVLTTSLLFIKNQLLHKEMNTENISYVEDVQPGGNKATLKISDGRNYSLNKNNNQISINDNQIVLSDGEKLGQLSESIVDLELETPRKGYYKAVLPDGTKVWLNAESKIIYPSKFNYDSRKVKVTGEVYLEVAKVQNSKFIVELSEDRKIEVLGTKFNISAYKEQNYIAASLIEGKIKISNNSSQSAILLPMHKATLHNSSNSINITKTNPENDIAWVNHKFNFEDLSFHEIMQQIARWYDVDIKYESKIPNIEFYGELNKNNSLQYIINVFKQSGVNMKLKNNTLIIK